MLTGSGPETGPWAVDLPLQVIPDDVDTSWWEWTTPQGENELWGSNNPYSVGGTLTNESQFAQMTITWTIIQIDDQGNQLQFGSGTLSQVEIGNIIGITSNTITQNWEWILLGVWVINGPTTRLFTYRVQFTVQDLFGNSYPTPGSGVALFLSASLSVNVNVAGWKYWAGVVAEGFAIAAAAELVIAGIAALSIIGDLVGAAEALAGIGAALYSVASASGAIARDPPKPSPKYKEVLGINYSKARKHLPISRFPGLSNFSESSHKIVIGLKAWNEIYKRMLGARQAGDFRSFLLQVSSYLDVVRKMESDFADLEQSVARATIEINRMPGLKTLRQTIAGYQKRGLPSQLRSLATKHGIRPSLFAYLERIVKSADFANPPPATVLLRNCMYSLKTMTTNVQQETLRIIGEQAGPQKIATRPRKGGAAPTKMPKRSRTAGLQKNPHAA